MSIVLDVCEHEEWVRKLAQRLDRKSGSFEDDLFQEGMTGLLQAATRFDPAVNESFKRYAYARVRGAMVDWFRKFLPGSRSQSGPFRALFVDSLDRKIDKTDRQGIPLTVGQLVGKNGGEARTRFWILCCEVLDTKELRIIEHVYFEKGTAKALREELGLSASRISQYHSKAKLKLREAIGSPGEMGDFEGAVGGQKVPGSRLSRSGHTGYQREYYFRVTKRKRAAAKGANV